jgi:ADP-ribose pyrophosphatase
MDYTEKKLRRVNRYEGIIVNVELDQIELPGGNKAFREVVKHPGGVCILPVDSDGNAWCVRQYRYVHGQHLLEMPAGKLEWGEEPGACAVRELSEETGFTAGRLIPLGAILTSPGFSSETLYLYLALDLQAGEAHPDENEFLDVLKVPFAQLVEQVMDGSLTDGKTVTAV